MNKKLTVDKKIIGRKLKGFKIIRTKNIHRYRENNFLKILH